MPNINFVDANGEHHSVDVLSGSSIMQAAVDNAIEGILGDCGGALSCATCHCHLDDHGAKLAAPMSDAEDVMLESVLERCDRSRLGCQVTLTDDMDGITVTLPGCDY